MNLCKGEKLTKEKPWPVPVTTGRDELCYIATDAFTPVNIGIVHNKSNLSWKPGLVVLILALILLWVKINSHAPTTQNKTDK